MIFVWSDMTLTLGLQTSFKLPHTLVKGATCVNYAPFYSKEEKICLGQIIFKVGAKSLYTRFSYVMFIWSTNQIRPSGKCTYSEKKDFCIVRFDLDSLLASFIQGYFIPLYKRSMRYIWPRGEKLSSRQGFYIKFSNDLNLRPSIIV